MKNLDLILKEMFSRVGLKRVNTKPKNWFLKHSWTEEEQEDFRKWLVKYLMENKEARQELMQWPRKDKKTIEKLSKEFIMNYGFTNKR